MMKDGLQDSELDFLPYDLLQAGRKLFFNLGGLFPNLSYPVIETLDRCLLDALFEAQNNASPDRMGDNATKDFILRHVYGIAAELIRNDVDLLRALLRLHYKADTDVIMKQKHGCIGVVKNQISKTLADRFIQVLKGTIIQYTGINAYPLVW
jgi:hypothetical protein